MDKKIISGVMALVAASLLFILMLPDESSDTRDTLPWNISHPAPDTTRIFGVTIGQYTLGDAEIAFREQAEISLFKPADARMAIEAFIEEVNFNGLKAKMVMTVALPPEELQGMFDRGLRMNSTPGGKRITLTPDDLARVRKAPVTSLTYMPAVRLEEAVIAKRFGAPAQRVRESRSGAVHWLYPQHGLDVALGGREKPVMQYVSPKDFELLRAPLMANGEVLTGMVESHP
ncbi:MAG: hypothetical protein HZC43_04295 [Nitrosomonadales bacterium]|nr:hypothetical protein [Nitrosomonadales bacterium]